jgi:ATP-binding cassette, subfamily B, bacterial
MYFHLREMCFPSLMSSLLTGPVWRTYNDPVFRLETGEPVGEDFLKMARSDIKNKVEGNLFGLLKPYAFMVAVLVILTITGNALNLAVPKIIQKAIDDYTHGNFVLMFVAIEFFIVAILIFVFTYLQSIAQTYASERVAKDLRTKLVAKISTHEYGYIQKVTPAKLLTNLTSDVDAVKMFVSMAIANIISSAFLIVTTSVLLLLINWRLALAVLTIVPIISVTFFFILKKVHKLFKKVQEAIDWLNKVINESILGSSLIRLLNSQQWEYTKFLAANTEARDISLSILRLFSILMPTTIFAANIATLIILSLGGHFVIAGNMSIGNFTAFNSYLAILIFPIIMIGFMSNFIAQASASYGRISEVLSVEEIEDTGHLVADLRGDIAVDNVSVGYGEKMALKNVSFTVRGGTKTSVIGPTAAGKTQLLYLLIGLLHPTAGTIEYDGVKIDDYDKTSLHRQIGLVFQDSIIFSLPLRENIAFSNIVSDADLEKAIATSEMADFINSLPDKLNTVVSERGTSLSGGQKQRIMLARALALNPKILLLDDFTSRVDSTTEQKILDNIRRNYPGITLISVTQKISSVEDYDQIVLLMEGELLAVGTHNELLKTSPEYVQIFNSQRSTSRYELHAD